MKKYLSIVLAIVMMFAICVPAFAADSTINEESTNPATADANVYTTFDTNDDTYTVTIPAEFQIPWKTDGSSSSVNLSYTVTTNLIPNSKVSVGVAANNGGKMDLAAPSATQFLTFTVANGTAVDYTGVNDGVTPTTMPTATVATFDQPIDTYTGTVTFTVTYTAAN